MNCYDIYNTLDCMNLREVEPMAEKDAMSVDSKKKDSFFMRKDIEISAKRLEII